MSSPIRGFRVQLTLHVGGRDLTETARLVNQVLQEIEGNFADDEVHVVSVEDPEPSEPRGAARRPAEERPG